jgi:replication initiation and membrane attachment protein DnaB
MADDAPKSAYEIAMERLRKKDAEQGIVEHPLTEEQKTEIAEIRRVYDARLAQAEVMHQSALHKTLDAEGLATLEAEYRREREQIAAERDRKIERVRAAEPPDV